MPTTINIRGVEEGDATIKRAMEGPERLGIIDMAPASRVAIVPEGATEGPAAQPQRIAFEPTAPQLSL